MHGLDVRTAFLSVSVDVSGEVVDELRVCLVGANFKEKLANKAVMEKVEAFNEAHEDNDEVGAVEFGFFAV